MEITYNYEENSWLCKQKVINGKDITICAKQWQKTKKGPFINFAILVGSLEESNNFFFEIEIFTKKTLQAKQFAEYCKHIVHCYSAENYIPLSKDILRQTKYTFWRCDTDMYYRSIGRKTKILLYGGIKYTLFRTICFWREANGTIEKICPKREHAYPMHLLEAIEQ